MTHSQMPEHKLKALFKYFVEVVRINLFLINAKGESLITPESNPYGWNFLVEANDITSQFTQSGELLEYTDPFHLHHFAIPTRNGYIILGPLIINKRLDRDQYREIALKLNRDPDNTIDSLDEIRAVSHNQLKSILDLIIQARDIFLYKESDELTHQSVENTLRTLLEQALDIAKAKSGSIMLYEENSQGLSIKASQGINPEYISRKPIRLSEGIAGYALKEDRTFILTNETSDNRIAHLLKRKEISQSIVMPFSNTDKRIRGVLNLNIEDSQAIKLNGTDPIIQDLTRTITGVLQTLQ